VPPEDVKAAERAKRLSTMMYSAQNFSNGRGGAGRFLLLRLIQRLLGRRAADFVHFHVGGFDEALGL